MGYTKEIFRKLVQAHNHATGAHKIVRIVDKKATGTTGGNSIAGWNVRTLNTILKNTGTIATLTGTNTVKLPAGTYEVLMEAPVSGAVGITRLKLVNVTASTDLLVGGTLVGLAALTQRVVLRGSITLTGLTELRVDHYTAAVITDGLGTAANQTGLDETYTVVEFRQETTPDADEIAGI